LDFKIGLITEKSFMTQHESLIVAAKEIGVTLETGDYSGNKSLLAGKINELIQNDFHKLISLLYRLDISEEKLKHLLIEKPETNAGDLIADLIIERQIQKAKSREKYKQPGDNISDEEKW
jgi:hypothetical protein